MNTIDEGLRVKGVVLHLRISWWLTWLWNLALPTPHSGLSAKPLSPSVTQVPSGKHCIRAAQMDSWYIYIGSPNRGSTWMLGAQGIVNHKVKLLYLLQVLMLAYGHVWIMIEALLKVGKLIFTHSHIISCNLLWEVFIKCGQIWKSSRSFRATVSLDVKNKTRNNLRQTLISSELLVCPGQETDGYCGSR